MLPPAGTKAATFERGNHITQVDPPWILWDFSALLTISRYPPCDRAKIRNASWAIHGRAN